MTIAGPCKRCGATNYNLSSSGPGYCPACACGVSISEIRLRERMSEQSDRSLEMALALAVLFHEPGQTMTPQMRQRGEAYLDKRYPNWRTRAHYARADGGESGTLTPVSQDGV